MIHQKKDHQLQTLADLRQLELWKVKPKIGGLLCFVGSQFYNEWEAT